MATTPAYNGYQPGFLGSPLPLPQLNEAQQDDLAPLLTGGTMLDYHNFSLQLSASRRFPYYVAANIDGNKFVQASREGSWKTDPRIDKKYQWGSALYEADKSDFDKGHMAKREDMQWGDTKSQAADAAQATFFYTNAVPQHPSLNREVWKKLENYILHTETRKAGLKVSVFTGPVLDHFDPVFVTEVQGQKIKLPTLFWKVVVFPKSDGQLCRVGFLMGQEKLLRKHGIIREQERIRELALGDESNLFLQFAEADTYQVNLSTIETLSGITMPPATDIYTDDRPATLAIQEVQIMRELLADDETSPLDYVITGLDLGS
jgi:endonuclease G